MVISRYKLLISFLVIFVLQGCGGSGGKSPMVENSDNSSEQTSKALEDLGKTTEPINPKQIFYIIKKLEVKPDENITTNYFYKDKYLRSIRKVSTDGWTDKKSYKYFENSKVMKTYNARDNLVSVSIFDEVYNQKNMNLYNRSLSLNENVKYLLFTNDSLTYHKPYHIKTFITVKGTGNLYSYNSKDLLTKVESGTFENSDEIDQLSNDKNVSYLLEPLEFESNQEIIYHYGKNKILTGITFEGQGGKLETDANVTLYNTGTLKELSLNTGDKFIYNRNGYLTTKTTVKNGVSTALYYNYSSDFKTVTVRDTNGKIVQQYTFIELK